MYIKRRLLRSNKTQRFALGVSITSTSSSAYNIRSDPHLDLSREDALLTLSVPLLDPRVGAERVEGLAEIVAGLVVGAAHLLATVVVQVALVAVPGLVRVGEPGVEWHGGAQFLGNHFSAHGYDAAAGAGSYSNSGDKCRLRKIENIISRGRRWRGTGGLV